MFKGFMWGKSIWCSGWTLNIVLNKFELKLCYWVHFWTITLEERDGPLYPSRYGLNSTPTVLLQWYLWHWITHKEWCAIKTKVTKPKTLLSTEIVLNNFDRSFTINYFCFLDHYSAELQVLKVWKYKMELYLYCSRSVTVFCFFKHSFFQAAVVLILLYGCTTWMLTKQMGKKLDGNYTRMLRAILNKSWKQCPTKQQLYGYLSPITKTIKVRRTKHAGHCWRSRNELISDVPL